MRGRAWAYLTAVAEPFALAAVAEDLFALPPGDLRRLAAAHVGMSPETQSMLAATERVLRELPSTVARSQVELRGEVRPPVAWRETVVRRYQTGDRSRFICLPPERRYDTPLARLVKLSLACCSDLFDVSELDAKGGTGLTVSNRSAQALRLARHAKLREVRLVKRLPAHILRGAARHPGADQLVKFLSLYREAIEEQAPSTLREVVTRQLLVPSNPDKLLELYVGFQLIDELAKRGWAHVGRRLLPGRKLPFARLRRGEGDEITIWYQRALKTVFEEAPEGKYRQTLETAGLTKSSLLPDFIVVAEPAGQVLLVEVKYTKREDAPDQAGIKDAFTYLHDAADLLGLKPSPRALVVAWSSSAVVSLADVMVASHLSIGDAIDLTLGAWGLQAA